MSYKPKCGICGSTNVYLFYRHSTPYGGPNMKHQCGNCGYKWYLTIDEVQIERENEL